MQIHKIIIGTGIAVAAALPLTTLANGITFPSYTPPPPSNWSIQGFAVPLPGGGVAGGASHNGHTTIFQHKPHHGGHSSGFEHHAPSGSGFGGNVIMDRGVPVGGGASLTFPFR